MLIYMESFVGLLGIAALIAAVINFLKALKIVPDGSAPLFSLMLNLIAFVVFAVTSQLGIFPESADSIAGAAAKALMALTPFVGQLVTSKYVHELLKSLGVPLIGTTSSSKSVA